MFKFNVLVAMLLLFASIQLNAQYSFSFVKDINPQGGCLYKYFTEYNGKLYFSAGYYPVGAEVWVTDGTSEGTHMLTEINKNPDWGSEPHDLTVFNGLLYFFASDEAGVNTFWKTDGTEAGTVSMGTKVLGSYYLTVVGNQLIFQGYDYEHGFELWASDGTSEGTHLVKDINPGVENGYGSRFAVLNNRLIFQALDNVWGIRYWITDGTENGTQPLININAATLSSLGPMTVFNGKAYFTASDEQHGEEIWVTDGTATGTHLFKDIVVGSGGVRPDHLTVAGSKMFFSAMDDVTRGWELWVTDGTVDGTYMVKDINPFDSSYPDYMFAFGDKLFFMANDYYHGTELWVSDGTADGTHMVVDAYPGYTGGLNPAAYGIYNNQLYFIASTPTSSSELWVADKDGANAVAIKPVGSSSDSPLSNTLMFKEYKGDLYFAAMYDDRGLDLWRVTSNISSDVQQLFSTSRFAICPNPATTTIQFQSTSGEHEYRIVDLFGNTVMVGAMDQNSIKSVDVSNLPSGLYLFDTGKRTEKFIKK